MDPYKILQDLELRATGIDPNTQKQQEGYFVAFRKIGLPIRSEEFVNPWDPGRMGNVTPAEITFPETEAPENAQELLDTPAGVDPEELYNDAKLAAISREQRAFINTHFLTNVKLQMSNVYSVMPGTSTVFDTWWAIVVGAQGVPGKLELAPEIRKAIDEAQALLMDEDGYPTRMYEQYMEYSDRYDEAFQEYTDAYTYAMLDPKEFRTWPIKGRSYKKK